MPGGKYLCRYICECCKEEKCEPRGNKPRFCSRSCKNKWEHANGIRKIGFDPKISWESYVRSKYGDEIAEQRIQEYKKKMSVAILASDMSLMKQVNSKKRAELNRLQKGKTLEELYGTEKAAQIKAKISKKASGELNPAYGKIYVNGGKSVKGYYKGFFFRSLFEYSFMKHLECRGISLDTDVKYESHRFEYEWNNKKRTYCSDFFVISENVLYEVKPLYALNNEINQCKFQAAQRALEGTGIMFRVVTENDFRKISFDEARKDVDVVWKEETFRYFNDTTNNN